MDGMNHSNPKEIEKYVATISVGMGWFIHLQKWLQRQEL